MTAQRKDEPREHYLAREAARKRAAYRRKRDAMRGPSGSLHDHPVEQVGKGLVLKGQSILLDRDGELKGRWDKSTAAGGEPTFEPVPEGHHVVKVSTHVGRDGLVVGQHITAAADTAKLEEMFWEACDRRAKRYRGVAPRVNPPTRTTRDLWCVYPFPDVHFGMLAWGQEVGRDWDAKLAGRHYRESMQRLVESAPPAEHATLLELGDFFHSQSNDQLTPRGKNKLDVDSRIDKVLDAGFDLFLAMIDLLRHRHRRVTVACLRGNHDPDLVYPLARVAREHFSRDPRVHVAATHDPFYFEEFGQVLVGAFHGEGLKPLDLQGVMSTDRREAWGRTRHHHWHCGHVHHWEARELHGCTVEYHDTLTPNDAYGHGKGFRSRQLLQVIAYHREDGEQQRCTTALGGAP
jgi:hypothetical protein